MSFRKASHQEFQHQFKDIRTQLFEQVKCMENRTNDQIAIFQEMQDFMKRRAEIDLQHSKELEKLVKSVMVKHKNERQRRNNWPLYSICNLWQQVVDDAKEEAKQRYITAEIYANNVVPNVANKCASLQKISKKCREISVLAQGEVIRVINELSLAMKTYQHCYEQFASLASKLQQADEHKKRTLDASTRKQRSVQKAFDKTNEKYEIARQKCTRARNEYLLCIDAANASLYKYFADDCSDVVDCCDLGLDWWLGLILQNVISARKSACQAEMNALANLGTFKDSLQSKADKQRFFENNHQVFMLPKRFHFKCEPSETISSVLTESLSEEFKQRHHQIHKRLNTLRAESEMSWRNMEEMERKMKDLLTFCTLLEINEFGIADKPPLEGVELELGQLYDSYLQTFNYFLLNGNLTTRLEARADGIGEALKQTVKSEENLLKENKTLNEPNEVMEIAQRRKRRIGSQASTEQPPSSSYFSRPRLFGGSLDEYTEATSEEIPQLVISCIRVLSQYALQHQGIFRISGSQIEINRMREAFESGDDPLKNVKDGTDANSIASLLKLYLRELREPLFPFYLFDLITDCAKCSTIDEFILKITPLMTKLSRASYLLLRYLFNFLNHLSEFSDENMMDPYNLAICFGPTLLPIPEGKDQVIHQNSVNEVVKNLIVHCDEIFNKNHRILGPRYEKYNFLALGTPAETDMELFMDDLNEEPFSESFSTTMMTQQENVGIQQVNEQSRRLPFLANYYKPNYDRDQISQFDSTGSTNSKFFDSKGQNIPKPMDMNNSSQFKQANFHGPNLNDFSNNYSSCESGIDASQMMTGLRLISPTQKCTEMKQQKETTNTNIRDQNEGCIANDNISELYSSIKRQERIRIPITPREMIINRQTQIGVNLNDSTKHSLINESNSPLYQSLHGQLDNDVNEPITCSERSNSNFATKCGSEMQTDATKKAAQSAECPKESNGIKNIDDLLNTLSSSIEDNTFGQ